MSKIKCLFGLHEAAGLSLDEFAPMSSRRGLIAIMALVALLLSNNAMAKQTQSEQKGAKQISESNVSNAYQLFETTNIYTFILLDTATGRAWQIQYSLGETPALRVVINDSSLLPLKTTPKGGRFTLYPTQNMYTFLLLDRMDGRIWQLQWSIDSENRGIVRSIPPTQ